MKPKARFFRWWHCLTHLHRAVTLYDRGYCRYIGCECGSNWLDRRGGLRWPE